MSSTRCTDRLPVADPDLPVLHRPDGTLQLGWGPETGSIVRPPDSMDSFDVGALIRLLDGTHSEAEVSAALAARGIPVDDTRALLDDLIASGVVRCTTVDGDAVRNGPPRLRVCGAGPLATRIVEHLSMWDVHWSRASLSTDNLQFRSDRVDCVVLTDAQVPDPHLVRALVRQRIPHLAVRIRDGRGLVGPFVVPGRTSCLRCADLVRSDLDPSWPRLASQLCGLTGRGDRAVALVTAGLAVGQLDAYFAPEGAAPELFDRTLEVDLRSPKITARRWFRHPECDCSAVAAFGQA